MNLLLNFEKYYIIIIENKIRDTPINIISNKYIKVLQMALNQWF